MNTIIAIAAITLGIFSTSVNDFTSEPQEVTYITISGATGSLYGVIV